MENQEALEPLLPYFLNTFNTKYIQFEPYKIAVFEGQNR